MICILIFIAFSFDKDRKIIVGISESEDVSVEEFPISELQQHPDVIEYLKENHLYDEIVSQCTEILNSQDELLLDKVNETMSESGLEPITKSELDKLNKKYGLEDSAKGYIQSETFDKIILFAEYRNDTICSVWYSPYLSEHSDSVTRTAD